MKGKNKLIFFIVILTFLLLGLSGCSVINQFRGGGTGGEPEPVPVKMGTLQCTKECAARGQCGTSEQGKVVLARRAEPAVTGHDRFFEEGKKVQIINQQMPRTLQQVSDGEVFPHDFNQVGLLDDAGTIVETAWLTNWCVQLDE